MLVGQHEADPFARLHQPFVARRVTRVALQETVAAEEPKVSRPRDGRFGHCGSRIDFPGPVVRLVIEQQDIHFRRLEPRDHDALAKIDQLGEFDPQRLFVPPSRFAEAVERDGQQAQLRRRQMPDHDGWDLFEPGGARRFDDAVAVDDCPVLIDKDRLADAELFDAGPDPRDLRGVLAAHSTLRLAQLLNRHIGHGQLRQQVVAPLRGVVGDLGQRALAHPAGSRLCFQSRREAVGHSDSSSARVFFGWHDVFLFWFPEHAVRKGRGDHPTEGRSRGLEAVNPTPWAGSHIFERPELPTLQVWNCRLAWTAAHPQAAAIRCAP